VIAAFERGALKPPRVNSDPEKRLIRLLKAERDGSFSA